MLHDNAKLNYRLELYFQSLCQRWHFYASWVNCYDDFERVFMRESF